LVERAYDQRTNSSTTDSDTSNPTKDSNDEPGFEGAGDVALHEPVAAVDRGQQLGELEERPHVPKDGTGFAGASKIIGSDTLLGRINTDARTQVDTRALLTAREFDLLIGDQRPASGSMEVGAVRKKG